jgi:crotonobetainyl-CoA:carnitine CoA-transferase CaiB-like acyl-CoA transferase
MPQGFERSEAGIGGAWLSAPFGIYRTRDGHLAIAMASLAVVSELLDVPELAALDDEAAAYAGRDEAFRLVQSRLTERTTDEWLEILSTRDVWCAPVQDFGDVVDDPQVAHNELLTTVPHPNGRDEVRVVGVPARFSATPGSVRTGPPAVGQHTEEVLSSLGYSADEIALLRDEGCI